MAKKGIVLGEVELWAKDGLCRQHFLHAWDGLSIPTLAMASLSPAMIAKGMFGAPKLFRYLMVNDLSYDWSL